MTDFLARLAALDEEYANAPVVSGGGMHPEGRGFVGEIRKAYIEEDKRPGEDTLSLKLHVHTDEGVAFPQVRLTNHPSERSMGFAKGQLMNIGHEGTLSQVAMILDNLIGSSVEIDVEHYVATEGESMGKTFANVYLRKLVDAPAGGLIPAGGPFAAAPIETQMGQVDGFPPAAAPVAAPAAAPAAAGTGGLPF